MKRFLMADLIKWKSSSRRKPLILNGARQVGKTWLLKEFGNTQFHNVAYINLDNNPTMKEQFEVDYNVDRLLTMMQIESGQVIKPEKTLIILDEIQECPKALTALKYFQEKASEYHIVAAGSLLGLTLHQGTGYPVGKVSTLNLYPLSFNEFLDATGNQLLRQAIEQGDLKILANLANKAVPLLRQYFYIGGMPEVISAFLEENDFSLVREIQKEILLGYERDISKHLSPPEAEATLAVWRSIPAHLSQENRKFIFGQIREGARARSFRSAITWLSKSGISFQVPKVKKPGIPLLSYADDSIFKLFLLDTGLLAAMSELDLRSIMEGNRIFTEFKGALTEQFVCQQLLSDLKTTPFYWSASNSSGEIDFLVHDGNRLFPIEVKAQENLQSKSLRAFHQKYPDTNPLRFSLSNFRQQDWMRNIPLWAIGSKKLWY